MRIARCAVQATFSFARVPKIISTYGQRLLRGFSMPIAWPAAADEVAQETARNMVTRDRFPVTGATWLLMVVDVIVWNPGVGFFAYVIVIGYRYGICTGVGGINFAGFCRGGLNWAGAAFGIRRRAARRGGKGGGVVFPFRWFRCGSVAPAKTGVHRSA